MKASITSSMETSLEIVKKFPWKCTCKRQKCMEAYMEVLHVEEVDAFTEAVGASTVWLPLFPVASE